MEENYPSERNLAYDRKVAVDSHNELQKHYDALPEEDKKWRVRDGQMSMSDEAMRLSGETNSLYTQVQNIDSYREKAKPLETLSEISVDQNPEKLREEKIRIDKQVDQTKRSIHDTTNRLNELRAKLNLPPTEDIPSLIQAKEKLGKLLKVQENVTSQVLFEDKKDSNTKMEETENLNHENKTIANGFENAASDLRRIAHKFEERSSQRFTPLFQDEERLGMIANKLTSVEQDESQQVLQQLINILSTPASNISNSVSDSTESLFDLSSTLRMLSTNIAEIPSKIQDDEKRIKLSRITDEAKDVIDRAAAYVNNKAHALSR